MSQNKPNIILKFSGEWLKDEQDHNPITQKKLKQIIDQVKELKKSYNIGIVIGGGNILRGASLSQFLQEGIDRADADYMGMMATMINAIAIKSAFIHAGLETNIYSLIEAPKIAKTYNIDQIREDLKNNKIVIFAGGTGNPYFSTDTGAALRAAEIHASYILMGKNGVDGVYSADPKKDKNAKHFDQLTYDQVIEKRLGVMDLTALLICKQSNTEIIVYNMNEPMGCLKALNKEIKTTIITK